MANYNPLSKPKAHLNRNGFDLSQRHTFSQRIGELLPVMCIDTVPGDHFSINVGNLVKTQPVKSDAFARIRQNLEFYFVPYGVMWRHWHQFVLQRDMPESIQDKMANYTPCFGLNSFLRDVSLKFDQGTTKLNSSVSIDALRLADMLGYGAYYSRVHGDAVSGNDKYVTFESDKFVNVFRAAAYQKIWYDYYRNKYYDTSTDYVKYWSYDDIGGTINFPSNVLQDYDITYDDNQNPHTVRDLAGGLFAIRYRQWKKDLFMSAMPTAQFGTVSTVGLTGSVDLSNVGIVGSKKVTDSVILDPYEVLLQAESGQYPKQIASYDDNTSSDRWNISKNNGSQFTATSSFSVYDLKRAEYLQKWKETVLRAGASIESQYKARFGTHSQVHDDHVAQFLGSYHSDLEINPIYNTTADSGDNNSVPLGEIGGRAQVLGNGNFNFDAQDYGVLMCISSFVPETEYNANMIDKQNTLTQPFDFFTPEFDNIGLEPVYHYQINANGQPGNPAVTYNVVPDSEFNHVLGYTSPWSMYKTAVDKCHDAFMSTGTNMQNTFDGIAGPYNNWVIPRLLDTQLQLKDFYINPYVDESIFYQTNFKETTPDEDGILPINSYLTSCHYLCDVYFDVKAVRPMSTLGLPQW